MELKEFKARRKDLMQMVGEDSIVIIPAAPERKRNRDVYHRYRQDSDFFYLTGFVEPEAVLVLVPGREHGEVLMFCREKDPLKETWDGRRVGLEAICDLFAIDDSFPISDIDDILPGIIEGRDKLYCTMGIDSAFDKKVMGWINHIRENSRKGVHPPHEIVSLENILHEMRLYKSAFEIKQMKRAAKLSAQAHILAMQVCKPGMMEYELDAEIVHHFMKNGATYAYPSIVGGGGNGCILHYIENNTPLKDGDLVLIDAGAEYDHYAGDISRTFPVNGKFSAEQKAVYEIVLEAQLAAINAAQPNNHWNQPHEAVLQIITQGLIDLGLLEGTVNDQIEQSGYQQFFMHRTGHWLGMDVHDVGDYKVNGEWRMLEKGMALTIEPGIYIAPSKGVDKRWWNIGIRIEDDVVITSKGNEVITKDAPKTVADIEDAMS
ncbi:MAG: Xaa-Pro aminopeptidase [Gammaproteobacteria bacterium]|nr:MAG: Xaa-Pro aminopeptidase [Gammaproteobacteria bacterium]